MNQDKQHTKGGRVVIPTQKEEFLKPPGKSREAEEAYLKQTLEVVRDNVENYGRDVAKMREDIDEMLEHFHDDNPEVINLLENTITMHDHLKRALERNERALNKPYFGRIDFHDETLKKEESLYIGKGGVAKDATTYVVVDWRAPVANPIMKTVWESAAMPLLAEKKCPLI